MKWLNIDFDNYATMSYGKMQLEVSETDIVDANVTS